MQQDEKELHHLLKKRKRKKKNVQRPLPSSHHAVQSSLPNPLSLPTTTTITSCIFLNQVLERNTKTWKEEEDEEDEELIINNNEEYKRVRRPPVKKGRKI